MRISAGAVVSVGSAPLLPWHRAAARREASVDAQGRQLTCANVRVATRYPIRYWLAVAYATGIPNFIEFDTTGKTHVPVFNAWSVMTIALTLLCCGALLALSLAGRCRLVVGQVRCLQGLWCLLLLNLMVASLLAPAPPAQAGGGYGAFLLVYRLVEWAVAFALLLSVYTREPAESRRALLPKLIGTVCCVSVGLVWCLLPVVPHLAYAGADDMTGASQSRLGGFLILPSHLGIMAGIAFFYFVLFSSGWRRVAGCGCMFATLLLTYARGALLGFLLVATLYFFVYQRSKVARLAGALVIGVCGIFGIAFSGLIVTYLARGNGASNITTLSERTLVWHAALLAFEERPWLGYGFIKGPQAILAQYWTAKHWIPPHCHNDLLQALVSGGIPAGALLLAIYGRTLGSAFRRARRSREQLFFLLALLQLTVYAVLGPLLTTQYSQLGALFLACVIGVIDRPRGARTMFATVPRRVYEVSA